MSTAGLYFPSLVEQRLASHVLIGDLWHDAGTIEHILHRYCKHIFVLTGDEQFPYSFRGSGTVVKFGGRHFMFCCRHQVGDCAPDRIAFRLYAENKIVSASSILSPLVAVFPDDPDRTDIVAFEYDTPEIRGSQPDQRVLRA